VFYTGFICPFRTDSQVQLPNRLHPDQKAPSEPDGKSTRYFCRLHTNLHAEQTDLRWVFCKCGAALRSFHCAAVSVFLPRHAKH
jgi:hypothetical protein